MEYARNGVVTDERQRLGDHVTTAIPTEYARANSAPAHSRVGEYCDGHVVTEGVTTPNRHVKEWSRLLPQLVDCPTCSAAPGTPCTNLNGTPYQKGTHTTRQERLAELRSWAAIRPRKRWASAKAGRGLIAAALKTPCPSCSEPIRRPHIDHVIPFNLGGPDEITNLRVICKPCNLSRPKDASDLDPTTYSFLELAAMLEQAGNWWTA